MPNSCKVCGSGNVSLFWSPRWGSTGYCSFRCSMIGTANLNLMIALATGIIAIGLIIVAIVIPNPIAEALAYGIVSGAIAIIGSFLSAVGFLFKRQDGY